MKILRRISRTIEYNIIEEFTFDDTTVFRELYDGLKILTPPNCILDGLTLYDKCVDLDSNIKKSIQDLDTTILYAEYITR